MRRRLPAPRSRIRLTETQQHKIMVGSLQLPPDQRHSFTLRIERKLALAGACTFSDALIDRIVASVYTQMMRDEL